MSEEAPVTDLAAFLLARIAEDEAAARGAEHADGPETLSWSRAGRRQHRFDNGCTETYEAVRCGEWDRILVARDTGCVARHIAQHDPARVLAECEAKRRIVALAGPEAFAMVHVLRLLALPYADHPDYRPDYRAAE